MKKHSVILLFIFSLLCSLFLTFCLSCTQDNCIQPPDTIIWLEGEGFVSAPTKVERLYALCFSASGGRALDNSVFTEQGATVGYRLALKNDILQSKIIFRFARFHFDAKMSPAQIKIKLTQEERVLEKMIQLGGTGGWGEFPGQFAINSLSLGDLKKGDWQLELTSLTPHANITLDGLYIAPASFSLTNEELKKFGLIYFFDSGYYGIETTYPIFNQRTSGKILVDSRTFYKSTAEAMFQAMQNPLLQKKVIEKPTTSTEDTLVRTSFYANTQEAIRVPVQVSQDGGRQGGGLCSFHSHLDFTGISDGAYSLGFPNLFQSHTNTVSDTYQGMIPVYLQGDFFSNADTLSKQAEELITSIKQSDDERNRRLTVDLQNSLNYLKEKKEIFIGKQGLGKYLFNRNDKRIRSPSQALYNSQQVVLQLESILRAFQKREDPYPVKAGLTLRAFCPPRSQVVLPYKMYIPESYLKQDKNPFIMLIHGGGGNEDYFSDLDDGEIMTVLEEYGYVAIMPGWNVRQPKEAMVDLIHDLLKLYPKLDEQRLFCAGISIGSFRTLFITFYYPQLFKAIACVSGMVDAQYASKIPIPILIIHGGSDIVVPAAESISMAARLEELGKPAALHIFPELGHTYHGRKYLTLTLDFFNKWGK
jgi:hypothetical protein